MTNLVLTYYFLPTCLVVCIFKNFLYLYAVGAYIEKSINVLLFIDDYFQHLYFVELLLLRSSDVETNPDPKKSSVIAFCH